MTSYKFEDFTRNCIVVDIVCKLKRECESEKREQSSHHKIAITLTITTLTTLMPITHYSQRPKTERSVFRQC